jgi:membrane-associated phospholipid phosphatase
VLQDQVRFLTDFADQAVLLPLALVVAVCLACTGWWRGLGAWLVGVGGTLGLMFVLKVVFIACGPPHLLRTPSGHTAAAAVICGGLMAVLAGRRRWAVPVAILAAAVIGATRLLLHAHLPREVVVGGLAGIGGAWLVAALSGPLPEFGRRRIALAALVVAMVLHGLRLPAEAEIRGLAYRLAHRLAVCQAPDDEALRRILLARPV